MAAILHDITDSEEEIILQPHLQDGLLLGDDGPSNGMRPRRKRGQ